MAPQWRPNKRARADEIDGAGDPAPGAFGHHQHDAVAHCLADQRIERPGEIGPAPFARTGLHIEFEECVPHLFGEIAAGEPVHADAVCQRVVPLAADGLALARRQRAEEIVEAREARGFPSETAGRCVAGSRVRRGAGIPARSQRSHGRRTRRPARTVRPGRRRRARPTASASGPARTRSRRPVAGVNGTATWSFG